MVTVLEHKFHHLGKNVERRTERYRVRAHTKFKLMHSHVGHSRGERVTDNPQAESHAFSFPLSPKVTMYMNIVSDHSVCGSIVSLLNTVE